MDVAASSDLATTTITPVRIVDTRPNAAALGGTDEPWGPLETRTVDAAGLGSIPDNAVGVVANVTALNASASGTFLTLFPTGQDMPNASTLNPTPGEIAFNAATVLLGPDGTFEIYNYTGTVDVIIDVTAYMTRALADNIDTVEEEVGRLQTGEILSPQKQPEYQYMDSGDYDTTTITNYSEWRGVVSWSNELTAYRGVTVTDGRFSESAQVRFEASVLDLDSYESVCFRVVSSVDGPLPGTESCTSGADVEPAARVTFHSGDLDPSTEPEIGGVAEYFFIEGPLGQMGRGTLYLQAKVSATEECSRPAMGYQGTIRSNCEVRFDHYQLRVFDTMK